MPKKLGAADIKPAHVPLMVVVPTLGDTELDQKLLNPFADDMAIERPVSKVYYP